MPFIAGRFFRRPPCTASGLSGRAIWTSRTLRRHGLLTTTNGGLRRTRRRGQCYYRSLLRCECGVGTMHRSSFSSSSAKFLSSTVSIGGIHRSVKHHDAASAPHLIPRGYLPYSQTLSQRILQHLQWMMMKDNLDQDMLLVGPPGAGSMYRRSLALMYAELIQQEVEVVTLSSDITESDLKQRRELVHSSFSTTPHVVFVDQAPVRAAIHGRILILDGVERAERNVLPTLNNLLENREMNLEDGRFLVSPDRYNQLRGVSPSSLSSSGVLEASDGLNGFESSFLVPTHRDFRVIALGVPCPPFGGGRSLDPPLRSRFQIRRIDPPSAEETLESLMKFHVSPDVAKLCATVDGIMSAETTTGKRSNTGTAASKLSLPACFPSNALPSAAAILTAFPGESKDVVLRRSYPFGGSDSGEGEGTGASAGRLASGTRQAESARLFERVSQETTDFSIESKTMLASSYAVLSVNRDVNDAGKADITFALSPECSEEGAVTIAVPCGSNQLNQSSSATFVRTKSANATLAAMMQEHYGGRDILLLGPKGEGKSALAFEFASMLGYDTELFGLHKDMSSLDLLMRRSSASKTTSSSFSSWVDSPLVRAARQGKVCILDGVEKLSRDCLASIHSLVTQREITLPDGSRLAASQLETEVSTAWDKDDGTANAAPTVHPNFRIVALASAHSDIPDQLQWLTDDVLAMFSTVVIRKPDVAEVYQTLMSRFPSCPKDELEKILTFHRSLTASAANDCGVAPLSMRNLIRLVKQVDPSSNGGAVGLSSLHRGFSSLFLSDLLPATQRSGLMSLLEANGIQKMERSDEVGDSDPQLDVIIKPKMTKIGNVKMMRKVTTRPELVPAPLFVDIPSHVKAIQQLLMEWNHGERSFLLLGNQGCGKNKIVDRLCQLAGFEREYMQLHRDSTVGQLTLSPYLENGRLQWKDSPLVRAMINGSSIVVDEADKAPLEVTSILKNLVEDGELLLPDGRRITRRQSCDGNTISIHQDFTIWVLGNRPGYPFHGNDFYREIGDCFSTHVIPNPDVKSEIQLLQSYAPSVPTQVIGKIAGAFAELRRLSDIGDLSYPYSTREAVSVARHLEKYPEDGIEKTLKNIVDFDSFDEDMFAVLMEAFRQHGMDINSFQAGGVSTSTEESLSIAYADSGRTEAESLNPASLNNPKFGKWDEKNEAHVGGNQWAGGTGGSDTAGLGGRGGPFRLDRGHKVHQVSDAAKAEVSKEAAEAARKVAEAALQERLAEIELSETAWRQYEEFLEPIKKDIASLRAILRNVKMRKSERVWLKHQSYGEIDDAKLVDGAAGERYIFKRRGFNDPSDNQITHERRRLRFVMDCSASMYRWNGLDGRLQRALEASALVMESFAGTEEKFEYSITGHSGDSSCITLSDSPPANAKERMRVLSTIVAHTQYCQSGDNTLTAMKRAMIELEQQNHSSSVDSDQSIVILVSDANLERYGIHPKELGSVVAGDHNGVKGYCIFIASFGNEADDIKRALPPGRGFVCMDTSDLPRIVRSILASQLE